jgi:predicted amidohydrolase
MQRFRIALVQMNALKGDLEHNLEVHRRFIWEAAENGHRLIVFPELSVTAHYGDEKVLQFAERATDGVILQSMQEQAKVHNVIVAYGFCEVAHGTYFNSHALVGPDGLIGVQRKLHASKDEYFFFRMGRSLEVFDLGFCKVGILICFDSEFFEAWRVMALNEAELILLPHASRSGWGKEIPKQDQSEGLRERLETLPGEVGVYARANAVFAAACNQVDFNGHSTHAGGAYVVGPTGQVIERSKPELTDLWIGAELDPELLQEARQI